MTHMTALVRPRKGDAAKLRRARRRVIETRERAAKDAAKRRDHYTCRRCGGAMLQGALMRHVEAAHILDKKMGGDHGRHSHHQRDYVTLCHACHQGPRSLHSGHVRLVYQEDLMGDGPIEFFDVPPGNGRIVVVTATAHSPRRSAARIG